MIEFRKAMRGGLFNIPFSDPSTDDLRKEAADYRLNLCLQGSSDCIYRGYFYAAHTMVELLREDNGSIDCVAFPVLFNYRHGTEVYLKSLIEKLSLLLDGSPTKPSGHKIAVLWRKFDELVERAEFHDLTAEHRRKIEACCRYIVKHDTDGQTWRYAEDNQGVRRSRAIGHHQIHLGVVQKAMCTLYNHLSWVDELISRSEAA